MNREKKHEGLDRYLILAFFIITASVAIVYNLANIQIVNGQKYKEESVYRLSAKGVIYPKRGDIFDRNGVPIAGSRMGFSAQYVDIRMPSKEKNAMLLEIIKVLEKDNKPIRSRLNAFMGINPIRFKTDKIDGFIKLIALNGEDAKYIITADQAFQYLREKTFGIDPSYTTEEAFKIMQLRYEILLTKPQINNPLLLADDISPKAMSVLEERSGQLRGVTTFIKPFREYYEAAKIIPHVLGHVGIVQEEQLKALNDKLKDKPDSVPYTSTDIVGKEGIERAAEDILRAVKGETFREVDENGKKTTDYLERAPVPGKDIYLTIDLKLQKVAVESLKFHIDRIRRMGGRKNFGDANAGAVVVLDVNTGEVLAMASYPDFDPRIFVENNTEEINKLYNGKDDPSFNRATSGNYSPGSTYKPLVAIAALQSGVLTPSSRINANYKEEIGDMMFTNPEGNQGYINLEKALETSSNMFFYKVGVQTGIDTIVKWAKTFGFARKTGIEIEESEGTIASREYKKIYKNEDWYPANTAMASIGQLYNNFTPIQLANYVSSIANDGKKYTPHLIKMAVDDEGKIVYEPNKNYEALPVKPGTIAAVKKGMEAVANSIDGTAADAFKDFPFKVAGKTGTAETGREATSSSNGLFVCYAPYDKPQIAIAVVVEKGVWGAYTAPIARDIMMEYFRLNEKKENDLSDKDKEVIDINW